MLPAPSIRKVGPASRIQESSCSIGRQPTPLPQYSDTSATLDGSAITVTGSNRWIVRATLA